MKIFIDTEFTDFADCNLISIGMVAETGEEFYREVPYPEKSCSQFVKDVVIPLLGKDPTAITSKSFLRGEILTWFSIIRNNDEDLVICYDYTTDWKLLVDALNYQVPSWVTPRLIAHNITEILFHNYFACTGLPPHHSLYDAHANRFAFRETLKPNLVV